MGEITLRHKPLARPLVPNPLRGRLFSPTGGLISQDFTYNRYGNRYRYYMPSGRRGCGVGKATGLRFRADEFDAAVSATIAPYVPMDGGRETVAAVDLLHRFVARIDIGRDEMTIALRTGATIRAAVAGRIGGPPVATEQEQQASERPETERAPAGEIPPMPVATFASASRDGGC